VFFAAMYKNQLYTENKTYMQCRYTSLVFGIKLIICLYVDFVYVDFVVYMSCFRYKVGFVLHQCWFACVGYTSCIHVFSKKNWCIHMCFFRGKHVGKSCIVCYTFVNCVYTIFFCFPKKDVFPKNTCVYTILGKHVDKSCIMCYTFVN